MSDDVFGAFQFNIAVVNTMLRDTRSRSLCVDLRNTICYTARLHLRLSRSLSGPPQMTWQPAPSIPLASQPSSWRRPVLCPSIPGCCPPISFSVCLVFSLLVLCPAGLSWQALKILLCARTILVCIVLLWSRGLPRARWLAEFCFAPLRWRCGVRR